MSRRSKFVRSRVNALKYYAEQLMLPHIPEPAGEPHKIITCCKCGTAKGLEFFTTGDGETYYKCPCGFESEPIGMAPFPRKGFDIP
jgi:hypothetical protein